MSDRYHARGASSQHNGNRIAIAVTARQKEEIIHKTTDLFASYFGEGVRPYTMVLVDEVVDGGWGRADETLTLAKMQNQRNEQ